MMDQSNIMQISFDNEQYFPLVNTNRISEWLKRVYLLPDDLFSAEVWKQAASLQMWASSCSGSNPEHCLVILLDKDGQEIARRQIEGY